MKAKERIKELKEMSVDELTAKHKELKAELFNLRFSHATGQLADGSQLTKCKKNIARVLTIIREREIAAASK